VKESDGGRERECVREIDGRERERKGGREREGGRKAKREREGGIEGGREIDR